MRDALSTGATPAAVLAVLLLTTVPPAAAQEPDDAGAAWESDDAVAEMAFLSLNAAVGGVTAGLWQELTGGSFEDGLTRGALGGTVVYAGKRVAAASFPAAGLLGRDLAAAGSSFVRNAADGRPLLDSLRLPFGPFRLSVSPRDPSVPRLEMELSDLYWTTYGLLEGRLTLEAAESLSSGVPVFRSDRPLLDADDRPVHGAAVGGVIFLSPADRGQREETLSHERVHVLQTDFVHQAWLRPLEEELARHLPGDGFSDRLDYDVLFPAFRRTATLVGWGDPFVAPIEAEADFLEDR